MKKLMMAATAMCLPAAALVAQAPTPAPRYVMMAGAGDQYERQSSKLVLETTANPKIRQFATMMISDHNKSTADIAAAAKRSRVTPKPPMLDAAGTRDVAALKAARGTARDTLYVQQQKLAHQKALALHQGYAASGDAPALKTVATAVVPVVQHHIEMLSTM